jgi:hypothetical protein
MAKKSFKNAISESTSLKEKAGIQAVFAATTVDVAEEVKEKSKSNSVLLEENREPAELRQSFIIREDYLDKLKDFVYLKMYSGNPIYNQKIALQDALDLLFASVDNIPSRPDVLKRQELKRNENIRKKRSLK